MEGVHPFDYAMKPMHIFWNFSPVDNRRSWSISLLLKFSDCHFTEPACIIVNINYRFAKLVITRDNSKCYR